MTPVVNGRVYQFKHGGLYDGLFLMKDEETGSLWNHITGECVYGELRGYVLETGALHHLTAGQTAAAYPEAQMPVPQKRSVWGRMMMWVSSWRRTRDVSRFPPRFEGTMEAADPRRPKLEMGVGVWAGSVARYYPRAVLKAAGNLLFDTLDGRGLVIYVDPQSAVPTAVYTEATGAEWVEEGLRLGTGEVIVGGLMRLEGKARPLDRPSQQFTRWYGFSYTFPECEVYGEKQGNC